MTIKVVKTASKYVGQCNKCSSVLEAKEEDLIPAIPSCTTGGLRWAPCPVCQTTVYFKKE